MLQENIPDEVPQQLKPNKRSVFLTILAMILFVVDVVSDWGVAIRYLINGQYT